MPKAGAAAADTTTSTQSFTQAGVYYVTVPQNVTAFSLSGLGGAGADGQPPSDNVSTAGSGGSGSSVTESFASTSNIIFPGDVLQVVVGAGGGGADGGTGDGIAGNGGNGGVTYIYNQSSGIYFLVAATAADGSTFTETVTVTNHGQWPATSVRTAVTVPSQLTVTADPGGTKTGPVVSWTDASLGVNQSVTYTITFKVAAKARGTALIAAATASPKVADPKPLNNVALITVKLG